MDTEKVIDYIFKLIVIILLFVLIFLNNKETVTSNNYYKDSVILIYKDTSKIIKEKIIENRYEYKIDSIVISYLPDSVLSREVMLSTKRILDFGFSPFCADGTDKGGGVSDGNNSSEKPATDSRKDD